MQIKSQDYRHISPDVVWFADEVNGTTGKAALSASRREFTDVATENWLITPSLHIASANTWMRWDARSVHHDLKDGYTVMISDSDFTGFKPVLTVDEENYFWNTRVLSLAEYEGKDIYVAICHNSTNKYMLAVDNLYVGELEDTLLKGKNLSRHFVGDETTVAMTGVVCNAGGKLNVKEIALTTDQGEKYTMPCQKEFNTSDSLEFEIEIPVSVGERYNYTVSLVDENNIEHELYSDVVICSYFPRTLLVEKFTGMWCNACPSATPFLYNLEERFGDEIAVVEVHGNITSRDPMSNDGYVNALNMVNYPTVIFNRNEKQTGGWSDFDILNNIRIDATEGYIKTEAAWTDDNKISVKSTVRFATETDNSSGRYRVGYLLREKHVDGKSEKGLQANNCTLTANEEFKFLPQQIPGTLIAFHNVARGGESDQSFAANGGLNGIKTSLPVTVIPTDSENEIYATSDLPSTVKNVDELEVVAVLFNGLDVMNVATSGEITRINNVGKISAAGNEIKTVVTNGECKISMPGDNCYNVTIYDLAGSIVRSINATGSECVINDLDRGYYIVGVKQGTMEKSCKLLITK